jgi:hypothetical protein
VILHLAPGLDYGELHREAPPDILPDPVVLALPVSPGAILATGKYRHGLPGYPGNPYLKTATAEFTLPTSSATAKRWYRTAFTAHGYRVKGTGESLSWGEPVSSWVQVV